MDYVTVTNDYDRSMRPYWIRYLKRKEGFGPHDKWCQHYRTVLTEAYWRYADATAKRFVNKVNYITYDLILSHLQLILLGCVDRFKPYTATSPRSYIVGSMKLAARTVFRDEGRHHVNREGSYLAEQAFKQAPASDCFEYVEYMLDTSNRKQTFENVIAGLPYELHKKILRMRYLHGMTLQKVADTMGLSKERIRQIQEAAEISLRKFWLNVYCIVEAEAKAGRQWRMTKDGLKCLNGFVPAAWQTVSHAMAERIRDYVAYEAAEKELANGD